MSPTIPPVLVLSLLLVSPPPPAEAGEMMDLFALIRGTLKYWRRIYQMYEEEVALGYCWAEYFLHHEEDSKNAPMSPVGSIDPVAEFVPVEEDAFANGVVTQWKDWVMSVNHGAPYRRSKRSYGASNSTRDNGISKMLSTGLSVFASIADEETSWRESGFSKSFQFGKLLENKKDLLRPRKNDRGCGAKKRLREMSNSAEQSLEFLRRNSSVLGSNWEESNLAHGKFDKNMENLVHGSKTKRHSYVMPNSAKEASDFFRKNSRVYSKIKIELGSSSNESKSNFGPNKFTTKMEEYYDARKYNLAKFPPKTRNSIEAKEVSDKIVATSALKNFPDDFIAPNVDPEPVTIRIVSKERIPNPESFVDSDSPRREFPRSVQSIKPNSVKEVIEEILKASEKSPRTGEWTASVKKSTTSDMYAEADEVKPEPNKKIPEPEVGEGDPVKHERFARNLPRRGRRSSGIPNSANADTEEISKILGNLSVRELSTSGGPSRTSETPRSKVIDPTREDTFPKGLRKRHAVPVVGDSAKAETRNAWTDSKSNPGKSNERRQSARKAASDMLSKTSKVKLSWNEREIGVGSDSRSIDRPDRIDTRFPIVHVDGSSFPVPSSSSEKQRASSRARLFSEKEKKMTQIDAEFKRSRAEGDLAGGSKLRVHSRRKLLYPTTGSVTSGTPTRLQPDKRQGLRRFPLGKILPLNSRFGTNSTSGELEDNIQLRDLRRRGNLDRSNLNYAGMEQQSRWNYRRNSRRKRDANDPVRILVRSLSKPRRVSSYDPSLDEAQRSSVRSGHPSHPNEVWTNGMKWQSTNPKNLEDQSDGNLSSLLTKRIDNPSKTEMYYLKSYRDTSPIDPKVAVRPSSMALGGIASVPFQSKDPSLETLGSSDHVPSRSPGGISLSEAETRKRANNRGEGSSWKQLRNAGDNRYRRTVSGYYVEKSIGKRTGKKSAIRHPVGRPSLLAVSQQRFMGDYGSRSSRTKDQGRRSSMTKVVARGTGRAYGVLFYLRQAFMGFLRTLGFFVNVGRQLMDYVDSNSVLACTKDYLVGKAIHWIDS